MPTADELLSAATVRRLAAILAAVDSTRSWSAVRASAAALDDLSFSERGRAVADALQVDLPKTYPAVEKLFRKALRDPQFSGWLIMPVAEASARTALASARGSDFEAGLQFLTALTPRLTAEFAIRAFLAADLDRALAVVAGWTTHRDPHVRRLASEGTRPRLPWAKQIPELKLRPEATLPILDSLYRDDEEYVRRSVANHLNDISRISPGLAVTTATRWRAAPADSTPRLVRHALRSLIKQADADALSLLGFSPTDHLVSSALVIDTARVDLGGELNFACTVENTSDAPVRIAIDYLLHFQKSNGTMAPKTFKLAVRTLAARERITIRKTHSFRPISTRVHYPGPHAIELQINGTRVNRTSFEVVS
jgi:3-methyladenine DNA glycosylase AlkC